MHLSQFDYELPQELIAQEPLERRDSSRMLILNRQAQTCTEARFQDFPQLINPNDVVVVNNTKVFPARLMGERDTTGGRVEVLLIRELEPPIWEVMVRPAHRLKPGALVRFGNGTLRGEILDHDSPKGFRKMKFDGEGPLETLINDFGETPLPPYIKRPSGASAEDRERYQTVFARNKGAIAAPTAGLHFTRQITEALKERGVRIVEVTLHVGYGTFEPVRVDNIEQHCVASESYQVGDEAAQLINETRERGRRVIAVGTTTARALESSVNEQGLLESCEGETSLTITPGYKFRITDALLTNFHLPRSSLLLLVSAFAGRDFVLDSYRRAVAERFRFYSYGDCMFVI